MWDVHHRINLYLLDAIDPEFLKATSAPKGRTVWGLFAHIHNIRLLWLKQAVPEFLGALVKIDKVDPREKNVLRRSIEESGRAMRDFLAKATQPRVERLKALSRMLSPICAILFRMSSIIAGRQTVLTLKQARHPVEKKILFAMWGRGVR